MKAKSVFENLDFERGEDPKKSLQIGDTATYQKIADMMKADGWTPNDPYESDSAIGWAVEYGHLELAQFLLERHGLPQEDAGALISWAAQNDSIEMVELLLSYNPNPYRLDYPLKMAIGNNPIWEVINNYIEENKIHEYGNFERGVEPKRALNIGKNRTLKKGDPVEVMYKGEKMDCIAMDDEEYDPDAERYFVDFMDSQGGICWATRETDTEEWWVPSANESQNFERGQDPKKSMNIGSDRIINKGDRFLVRDYHTGKFQEVTAVFGETTEWGATGEPERNVWIEFDDGEETYAYKDEETGIWEIADG